VEKGF